jgi:hypothetical protein
VNQASLLDWTAGAAARRDGGAALPPVATGGRSHGDPRVVQERGLLDDRSESRSAGIPESDFDLAPHENPTSCFGEPAHGPDSHARAGGRTRSSRFTRSRRATASGS